MRFIALHIQPQLLFPYSQLCVLRRTLSKLYIGKPAQAKELLRLQSSYPLSYGEDVATDSKKTLSK
jgi:hypothetical protein